MEAPVIGTTEINSVQRMNEKGTFMKLISAGILLCLTTAAFGGSSVDYEYLLREENNLRESLEFQKSVSGAKESSLSSYASCISEPLPATPEPPVYQFTSSWGRDDQLQFTLWRQPCEDDARQSVVLMRVDPTNEPFLCSSSFIVIQDGRQYDSIKLVDVPDGSSFCDDLYVPMTLLLEQWSFETQFDDQSQFTLIHEGVYENNSVVIPQYSYSQDPVNEEIVIGLEEPRAGDIRTGVGNLRGWAVAPDGIHHVELYLDGEYRTRIPYGASRRDVESRFPDYPESLNSGFSMAYNYGVQNPGSHAIKIRAVDNTGRYKEVSANFKVIRFHEKFFSDPDAVDVSSATVSHDGSGVVLTDLSVGGLLYDVKLKWSKESQNFSIYEIR